MIPAFTPTNGILVLTGLYSFVLHAQFEDSMKVVPKAV